MKRAKDILNSEVFPEAVKIGLKDVIGKDFVILDFKIFSSNFKPGSKYATVLVQLDNEKRKFNTGSTVLLKQLEQLKEHLPVIATIKKRKQYFVFE